MISELPSNTIMYQTFLFPPICSSSVLEMKKMLKKKNKKRIKVLINRERYKERPSVFPHPIKYSLLISLLEGERVK